MTNREIFVNFVRDVLRPRTMQEIINKDLREAYISKMQAEQSLEYATSIVEYNRQRIRRLEERLKELGENHA
jgi:hypothetical protein